MTDTEKNFDKRVTKVENQVSELTANVNALIRELKDFKTEMRDRDNQRAAEIRNLENKRESEIREIRSTMQNMQNSMREMQASNSNLNIVTIIGIAAIVIAVLLK